MSGWRWRERVTLRLAWAHRTCRRTLMHVSDCCDLHASHVHVLSALFRILGIHSKEHGLLLVCKRHPVRHTSLPFLKMCPRSYTSSVFILHVFCQLFILLWAIAVNTITWNEYWNVVFSLRKGMCFCSLCFTFGGGGVFVFSVISCIRISHLLYFCKVIGCASRTPESGGT